MNDPAALLPTPMDQAMPRGAGFIVTRADDGAFNVSVVMNDEVVITCVVPTREQVEKLILDALRDNGKKPRPAETTEPSRN